MTRDKPDPISAIDWSDLLAHPRAKIHISLAAALALANESIQIWDATGALVLANPPSKTLFGHDDTGPTSHLQIYGDCLKEDGSPFQADELPVARILASGRGLHDLMLTIRPDENETRWLKLSGYPVRDHHGVVIGAVVTATDITDFIKDRQRLEHLASYDALTQLPNRILLAERMHLSLARGRRANEIVALCMLDLDGFKTVNDTLGHKAGDELLREVALRLRESIRGDDTVARLGGDEFTLLLCGIRKVSECEQTLGRLLGRIRQPYQIAGQTVKISASAGVALFPADGSDPDSLLGHADTALYQAKEAGKNRFQFFDRKLDLRLQANRGLLGKIEKAIHEHQFLLYYQPIVDCRAGRVVGAEALIRWRHPVLGLLAPQEFLPLIDHSDLALLVGEWVIETALRQLEAWDAAGWDIRVSVNLFAHQLVQPGFADWLAARLATYPEPVRRRFGIEVSESGLMTDINTCTEVLRECRRKGIGIALDNFGIGYASLPHLKRLLIGTLKIDQSYVQAMLQASDDLAAVGAMVGLATPFGCQVAAEGAETVEQVLTLLELGCDVIQGYSLAHPMPPDRFESWMRTFQPDPLWSLSYTDRPTRDHFDLLLAEANFRAWFDQALELCKQNRYDDHLADPRLCPFGKWLSRPDTERFRSHDEFRLIECLHRSIHGHLGELGGHYLSGRTELAKEAESALFEEHAQLLHTLRALRARLSHEPRLHHPCHEETTR